MAKNNCFKHEDCNGTSSDIRYARFNKDCNVAFGENIAISYDDALYVNNLFICEKVKVPCVEDGSGDDGHRANLMDFEFTGMGVGVAKRSGSPDWFLWTQDFAAPLCNSDASGPIHSGSHVFLKKSMLYMVDYYNDLDTDPVLSAFVVFEGGDARPLSLDLGTETA
eukprot:gene6991-8121_t